MSRDAVIVLNFGEPHRPTLEEVVPFLERIFHTNANLEDQPTPEARRKRSRELAERRAPALIAEYEQIGSSPMNAQSDAQATALAAELTRRRRPIRTYSAFQFTDPLVADVVARARADGATRLIGLPIYPLCGPSTTVAALNDVQAGIERAGGGLAFVPISGWHRHPLYLEMRADGIRTFASDKGVDLAAPDTRLVFSAHGTPKRYLDEGSRYETYVQEYCREVARRLGVGGYELGYQNHTNRNIEWTQPDIDRVVNEVKARRIVVDACSFMHEQSETLAELDIELRERAEERGLEFFRVPIPHDDPRFAVIMADLVEGAIGAASPPLALPFSPCRCRPITGTVCLNAR